MPEILKCPIINALTESLDRDFNTGMFDVEKFKKTQVVSKSGIPLTCQACNAYGSGFTKLIFYAKGGGRSEGKMTHIHGMPCNQVGLDFKKRTLDINELVGLIIEAKIISFFSAKHIT